jgi:predicted nucleic acid-binding protein
MSVYAVIDTNVVVSAMMAVHANAATVRVVGMMYTGEITPLYNEEILAEYYEVLRRKKFNFTEANIHGMLSAIEKYGVCVDAASSGETLPDMKDLPFYEVVLEKRDDDAYLVTGNIKHFPQKPFVVTPKQMLEIITGKK